MQCEICQAELEADSAVCEQCGALVAQNIQGFRNTKEIQRCLKSMIDQHGENIILNNTKFIALLNDYIPEFEKERGLLKNMSDAGVLRDMSKESNHDMAIMDAKSYMLGKLFLSENAVEFVISCYTFMLGWPYVSPLREIEEDKEEIQKKKKVTPINIEQKVFSPIDAAKYRFFANINIAEGYTKIDSFSFDKFGFLKTVNLPSTMLCIGDYAFSECKHLKAINLPESLRIIKQGAFSECIKLTVINIPKGVLEIEDNTFQFCQNLEVIEIPSSVGSIGASAFQGCEKLRKLFLPDSIKFIENDAFSLCSNLTITCYENSYVHKFCMNAGIDVETVSEGNSLRSRIVKGGI